MNFKQQTIMDKADITHRDQVLRNYFLGRNWDQNNEYSLKRKLVMVSHKLLSQYPYLVDDEWEVEASQTQHGKGDLIFSDGTGCFAVVEVKWIDLSSNGRTGSTKRTSNKQKRRKVEEQAVHYARQLARRLVNFVQIEGYSYTNQNGGLLILQETVDGDL